MTDTPKLLNWRMLIAAVATVGIVDMAFGLTLQVQPLLMEARGNPAWIIGSVTAMGPLGILLTGPWLPKLVPFLGERGMAAFSILLLVACVFAMALLPPPWFWYPARFMFGVGAGALFMISEAWMVKVSNEKNRGRIMGVYSAVLAGSFGIGPLIVPYTGFESLLPWLISAGFLIAGLLPILAVPNDKTAEDHKSNGVIGVIKKEPLLFASICTATMFDSTFIPFFTIYGKSQGLALGNASTLMAASIISGGIIFFLLGMLADKWLKHRIVLICVCSTILCALALPYLITTLWAWPLIVVFANSAFGIYVVGLAINGDRFKTNDLVPAAAAIGVMWGIGGLISPPIAGLIIDTFGYNAFPYYVSGLYGVLLAGLLANGGRVLRPLPKPST